MTREEVESEVTGNVWKIEVEVGDQVEVDDTLMIIESMKMEIPVESPVAGKVAEILVEVEGQVEEGQIVAVVET